MSATMTMGLIGLALGAAASAGGTQFRVHTFQGPGNFRIPVGATVSFFGGMIMSVSIVQLFLSMF
jgi:hypothetical protein